MSLIYAQPALPLADLSSLMISFAQSDAIGKGIIFILIVMSIVAWSVMISKWMEMKRNLALIRQFQDAYSRQNHPFSLFMDRKRLPATPLYTIYFAAAREAAYIVAEAMGRTDSAPSGSIPPEMESFRFSSTQMDIIRRAADRASSDQVLLLEDKMPILAISISAAPFLGLLGTVWGVLDAFVNMSTNFGGALLSAVAPGISGALLTTVVGLLVALPSAIGYNLIVSDIRRICVRMDAFSDELMADLQSTCSKREL